MEAHRLHTLRRRGQPRLERQADNSYVAGKPKTRYGYRDVLLDEDLIVALRARDPRLSQSVYYQDHWLGAVGEARRRRGLTKMPRVHDLRHSHWPSQATSKSTP